MEIKELKEIQKRIVKAVKLEGSIQPKTIAGFDVVFTKDKAVCAGVVMDYETKEIVETADTTEMEVVPHSLAFSSFRSGMPIMNTIKKLSTKADLIIVSSLGLANPENMSVANYVGVMANKPAIGVSKELVSGFLDEDRIMHKEQNVGYAIRTKEFANPIFVIPGHSISVEESKRVVEKLISPEYKLPLILHEAHKLANKVKKQLKDNN